MSDQITPVTLSPHAKMKIKNARIFKGDDNQYYGFFKNRYGLWELAIDKNVHKLPRAQLMFPTEWPLMIIQKGTLPASDAFMRTVVHTYGVEFEKKPVEVEKVETTDVGEVTAYLLSIDRVLNCAYYYTTHAKWDYICFSIDPLSKYGLAVVETDAMFTTRGRAIHDSIWENWIIDVPIDDDDVNTKIGKQLRNILSCEE